MNNDQKMIKIDLEWWKTFFNETYLMTDVRTVWDEGLTKREVDFLEAILRLDKSWSILDLCRRQGRHSIEFSRRGFQDVVTVLDYSTFRNNLAL